MLISILITSRACRRRPADEGGFTLAELVVAMTLLLLVLGALLSSLESLTTSERTTSTRVDDEQALRLTLTQFTRDLRDANPIRAASPSSVDFLLGGTPTAEIRWSYDAVQQALIRTVLSGTSQPTTVLSHVAATALSWLNPAGQDLTVQPWATAADVAHCATEVRVRATLVAHPGVASTTQTAATELRNQPYPTGCG